MLLQVCVPLFDKIRQWVFEGRLEDPDCEFFIVAQAGFTSQQHSKTRSGISMKLTAPHGRDPWREGYKIEPAKLPPFISAALAQCILRAGKSINFLRDSCGDVTWAQERVASAQDAAASVGFGQVGSVEAFVQ